MSKKISKLILDELIYLHVDCEMTLKEISEKTGRSMSGIRYHLLNSGALRTFKESQILAASKGRKGAHLIGKTKVISDATKEKIRKSRLAWSEKHAKGVSLKPSGYLQITVGKNKNRNLHVVLMENHIGRSLRVGEVVHHIDGDKLNNNIANLQLMTNVEHVRLHAIENNEHRKRDSIGRYR